MGESANRVLYKVWCCEIDISNFHKSQQLIINELRTISVPLGWVEKGRKKPIHTRARVH
jgi:hypothetical protein